ncbi:hypothetical protein DPMN_054327 [Dreissena polymorpha]|uniref:Uncharacterized protein n=1 Tax=Dreissena polymorpha TaxID=45954 RepID=A0A9D4CMY2_DREPO|nr:hypothetical protein DPMN_054327 [Dreissena polymorpha]
MEIIHNSETIIPEHQQEDQQSKRGISTDTTENNPLEETIDNPNPNIVNQLNSVENAEADMPTPAGFSETIAENGNQFKL